MKKLALIFTALFLAACGSNPNSYIEPKKMPIVNIEAEIAELVDIDAQPEHFELNNKTDNDMGVLYKLFWYDALGVSQAYPNGNESSDWQNVWLYPQEKRQIAVDKVSEESRNYRIYLRGAR